MSKISEQQIRTLLNAISVIMRVNQPYKDKIEAIIEECNEEDKGNLGEFAEWINEALGEGNHND